MATSSDHLNSVYDIIIIIHKPNPVYGHRTDQFTTDDELNGRHSDGWGGSRIIIITIIIITHKRTIAQGYHGCWPFNTGIYAYDSIKASSKLDELALIQYNNPIIILVNCSNDRISIRSLIAGLNEQCRNVWVCAIKVKREKIKKKIER